MGTTEVVRGYKVFKSDWTCRGKQYACPGKFEENVEIGVCSEGMHFCKKPIFCFKYYEFDPDNKVAEVIAYGKVDEKDDKCCTDKLEIVREIPWSEVLELVNTGKGNTGKGNTGNFNSGSGNSGNRNAGSRNSGDSNRGYYNAGDGNSGSSNSGDGNSGDYNSGGHNSGYYNAGEQNAGHRNTGSRNGGNRNTGDGNSGCFNTGKGNSGDFNTGNRNSGSFNVGSRNSGNYNNGCYNTSDYSIGCFNTIPQTIYLFNKPSDWTMEDWDESEAWEILQGMPCATGVDYVRFMNMTDEENKAHPEAEVTGGYLKEFGKKEASEVANQWWNMLPIESRNTIMAIPNFDKDIFLEITGIDVTKE